MTFRTLLEDYKTQQRKTYDCGVATTVSLLKYFNKDYKSYLDIQDVLDTKKSTGTDPESIVKVLKSFDLTITNGFGKVGYILLNVESMGDTIEDDQNGHWVTYEHKDDMYYIFDVWTNKTTKMAKEEILELTKNINVKGKRFNDYIMNVK